MKRLFFLRHGNAAPMSDSDIFRVLTNEGKKQVETIANQFKTSNFEIGLIISSPASRAKETAEIFHTVINSDVEILYESFIYEGYTTNEIIEYFNDLPDLITTVLFVGHNPNISNTVNNLAKNINIAFSPAEIIGLEFDIQFWYQLEVRTGEIIFAKRN